MPFLSANQQHQSCEGLLMLGSKKQKQCRFQLTLNSILILTMWFKIVQLNDEICFVWHGMPLDLSLDQSSFCYV